MNSIKYTVTPDVLASKGIRFANFVIDYIVQIVFGIAFGVVLGIIFRINWKLWTL